MELLYLIGYTSRIVWSLPPFRQYKGKFFNYFLIMAMSDPVASFLIRLGYKNSFSVYAVVAAATLLSVIAVNKNIRFIPSSSFILFTLAAVVFMPLAEVKLLTVAILLVLIYFFIRHIVFFAVRYGYVSIFHILFLIYNASLVFKLVNNVLELQKGSLYFYSTTIFEIVLGILFCIFREDDKRFALSLTEPEIITSPLEAEFITRENESLK